MIRQALHLKHTEALIDNSHTDVNSVSINATSFNFQQKGWTSAFVETQSQVIQQHTVLASKKRANPSFHLLHVPHKLQMLGSSTKWSSVGSSPYWLNNIQHKSHSLSITNPSFPSKHQCPSPHCHAENDATGSKCYSNEDNRNKNANKSTRASVF